jgi:hypothetical protein
MQSWNHHFLMMKIRPGSHGMLCWAVVLSYYSMAKVADVISIVVEAQPANLSSLAVYSAQRLPHNPHNLVACSGQHLHHNHNSQVAYSEVEQHNQRQQVDCSS